MQVAQPADERVIHLLALGADDAINLAVAILDTELANAAGGNRFHFGHPEKCNQCMIEFRNRLAF